MLHDVLSRLICQVYLLMAVAELPHRFSCSACEQPYVGRCGRDAAVESTMIHARTTALINPTGDFDLKVRRASTRASLVGVMRDDCKICEC